MIDEVGYWKAKKRIEQLKKKYSTLATSSINEYERRKWYGVCDGITLCLKELAHYAEQPHTMIKENETSTETLKEDISDLLEDDEE